MSTITGYVPFDYRRVCDGCGNLYNRSKLTKNGPYLLCPDHAGERIAETLDRLNARQRPFRVLPVPNAKPDDERAPDVFEGETSQVFALLDKVRAGGGRYLQVKSGSPTPLVNAADALSTNTWAMWFYYALATATYRKGHKDEWHDQALVRLRETGDALLARQSLTGTRATNSFYGGFLATGTTTYFMEDAAVGGLGLLYAYRSLGDIKYLWGARNAASFLRNLQAIGSNGVHFTSSDPFGTARLYTGGITNAVYSGAGFYSDHRFFAASLLALRFWFELKLTDGDQSLGATAAIAGDFTTAPSALLTTAMADLRDFWETGTYDTVTLDVRTGLSTTTPAEFFNAYPGLKPNTSVMGSGSWEFYDNGATSGTQITAGSIAKGLASLYAVDGQTSQVTTIADWLQSFTSNATYATPAASSELSVQHATTGTYDATLGIAKLLLVRDSANNYAATKQNAGSLYDWGAFGVLAPLWSARYNFGFKTGRYQSALGRRRLSDGLPSDGEWYESGLLRGRTGLTYQTSFLETLEHGGGPAL